MLKYTWMSYSFK